MKIGVDVGGTNTDAVVLGPNGVLGWRKTPTTADVYSGIVAAITQAIADASVDSADVDCVMIGTTQFTNAVIQRRSLLPVGIIRLALPATSAIPPLTDWPDDLITEIGRNAHLVGGGYEFDGREIAPLDEVAVAEAARSFRCDGIRTAAITSVFSPMNGDMERRAAEIVQNEVPDIAISLSCELGQFGLLPRENSTIINAALSELSSHVVQAFRRALQELAINVPLFISQNDGTLMRADDVQRYPVLTFASGPTNSMRGAVYLAGIQDAMVVDIGGTTSDIGMLRNGFPRQSTNFVDVGGVKTNFRMPDVLAVGLGGGSLVREAADLPLLVVGGGAILVDWPVQSVSDVLRPEFSSVANAVGAAIAQVSGEVERVVTLNETNRKTVLDDARQEAKDKTISAGATAASVEIIEVEQVPISYLPGNPTRLRVKAVGDLPI
jgi:N-methylhydantoinase A/oxoprolinase/acetone carboxylase beta subunit